MCYELAGKNCCSISMNSQSPVNSRDGKDLFLTIQIVQNPVNSRDRKDTIFRHTNSTISGKFTRQKRFFSPRRKRTAWLTLASHNMIAIISIAITL